MDADVLGWVASVAFLLRLLPQPLRLARTGVPDGVSPLAALNAAVADTGWVAYGLVAGLVPVWTVSSIALALSGWTAWLLRREVSRRDLLAAGVWLAAIVLAAPVGALGAVLAVTVVVCHGPQVWVAVRQRELSGIAPATWWLALLDGALWGAYGAWRADAALIGYGVVMVAAAFTILGRVAWTRRRVPAPAFAT